MTSARFIGGIDPDGWVVSDETSKHFHKNLPKFCQNFANLHNFLKISSPFESFYKFSSNSDENLRENLRILTKNRKMSVKFH